jgi:hypothetical protein
LKWSAAGGTLADGSLFFFNFCPGSGEGRENRPQLRCGNVSNQTHTLRTNAGAKPIGVASGEGEGRGRGAQARKYQTFKIQIPKESAATAALFWDLEI